MVVVPVICSDKFLHFPETAGGASHSFIDKDMTILRRWRWGFRRICAIFRTPPHGVESRVSSDFFSALDGQQLLVVEGSGSAVVARSFLPGDLAHVN